ncbi:hypothetical protein B0T16DRAFT_180839 [Cercophora newfieldiana]|uniref:Uncharacterized protein n=1 Tax=Cercophora newfieldiana TaxID=92897 RepID=A0AA39Y1H0_9PEZI|nr:hypothetical protein B0T16DRAFT_180839 [Cercophora newfieldiana]
MRYMSAATVRPDGSSQYLRRSRAHEPQGRGGRVTTRREPASRNSSQPIATHPRISRRARFSTLEAVKPPVTDA